MNKLVLTLSLTVALLVGCIIGGVGAQLVVPPVRAGTNPAKWEYSCTTTKYDSPERVTEIANKYGRAGWEMSTAVGGGSGSSDTWCFKRRLP